MEEQNKLALFVILTVGVISVGVSSILIRLTNAEPIVIAIYRLTLSAIMVMPLYITYPKKISIKEALVFLPLGALLSLHFTLWIYSLKFTTVTSSTVLVTTNPIFVPIFSYLFYKRRIKKELILGIAIAMSGSIFIALSSRSSGTSFLFGNILALLEAIVLSMYLTLGKEVRNKYDLIPYIFFTYSFSAVILIIIGILTKQNFFGYDTHTYFMFFLVAFIPQILGHTAYNYSLKFLDPSFIARLLCLIVL